MWTCRQFQSCEIVFTLHHDTLPTLTVTMNNAWFFHLSSPPPPPCQPSDIHTDPSFSPDRAGLSYRVLLTTQCLAIKPPTTFRPSHRHLSVSRPVWFIVLSFSFSGQLGTVFKVWVGVVVAFGGVWLLPKSLWESDQTVNTGGTIMEPHA